MKNKQNDFKYDTTPVFHKTNSESAIIVLHGYLGSSQSMIYINNALIKKKYTIMSPNLLGHGTVYSDLHNINYVEWIKQVEDIYLNLRKEYKKIFIIGFSSGGTLALYLAENYNNINGIVTINSPLIYPLSILFTPYFKNIIKYFPSLKNDIKDPDSIGEYLYEKVSVKNSHELLKLSIAVRKNISKCKTPILIFKSVIDHRVSFKNGKYIYNKVSSLKKELIYLKNSYHAAMLDYDKELIIKKVLDFIIAN